MIRVLLLFLFSLSYSLDFDEIVKNDQILVLGYQRIKTFMLISNKPFDFFVNWEHDTWSEDVLKVLFDNVKIKGGHINWLKRKRFNPDDDVSFIRAVSFQSDVFHIIVNSTEYRFDN